MDDQKTQIPTKKPRNTEKENSLFLLNMIYNSNCADLMGNNNIIVQWAAEKNRRTYYIPSSLSCLQIYYHNLKFLPKYLSWGWADLPQAETGSIKA